MSPFSNPPHLSTTYVPKENPVLQVSLLDNIWPEDIRKPTKSTEYEFVIKIWDVTSGKPSYISYEEKPTTSLSELVKFGMDEEDWEKATDLVFYQRVFPSTPNLFWMIVSPLSTDFISYEENKRKKSNVILRLEHGTKNSTEVSDGAQNCLTSQTSRFNTMIRDRILDNKMQGCFYTQIDPNTVHFYSKDEKKLKATLKRIAKIDELDVLQSLFDTYNDRAEEKVKMNLAMKTLLSGWEVYHSSDGIWILYPFIGENIIKYVENPNITPAGKESVVRQLIREIMTCHKEYGIHFGTSPENVVVNASGFVVLAGLGSSTFFMRTPTPDNKKEDMGDNKYEAMEGIEEEEEEDMRDDEDEEMGEDEEMVGEDEEMVGEDEEMWEDVDMGGDEEEDMSDEEDDDMGDEDEKTENDEDETLEDEETQTDSYLSSLSPTSWKLMYDDWEGCVNIISAIIQGCTNDPKLRVAFSEVRDKIEGLLHDTKESYPKVSMSSLSELELFKNGVDDRNMRIPKKKLREKKPHYYIFGDRNGTNFSIKRASLDGQKLTIYEKTS